MAQSEIKHIKPNHSTKPQLFLRLHSRPSAAWLCWPFLEDGARGCPPCLGMFGSSESIWPCNKATANIGWYSYHCFPLKIPKMHFWGRYISDTPGHDNTIPVSIYILPFNGGFSKWGIPSRHHRFTKSWSSPYDWMTGTNPTKRRPPHPVHMWMGQNRWEILPLEKSTSIAISQL